MVLYYDKPVIPTSLRLEVMEHLHAGHQGVNAMFSRASSRLYWPRYKEEITNHRAGCVTCNRIAPSNPTQPATLEPDIPSYPFQSIVADFFSVRGQNYLAVADRHSNWLCVGKLEDDDTKKSD